MTESGITTAMSTIFVIDDDASVRRSLSRLLSSAEYLVEAYDSADAFLQRAPYQGHGCIILDVNMPGLDGMALYEQLLAHGYNLPVIFLTGHGDIPMSVSAMKKGASDFLIKPVDETVLLATIAEAMAKYEEIYNQHLSDKTTQTRLASLTVREHEVLQHVIAGERNKDIAHQLAISEKTVKVHRARVMEKMGVNSAAELVRVCMEIGVVPEVLEKQ
jgi:FixJ family two-component response regulator